jgi:hypothetical protein
MSVILHIVTKRENFGPEDVVDKEKHVLAFFVAEVFCNCQAGESDTIEVSECRA